MVRDVCVLQSELESEDCRDCILRHCEVEIVGLTVCHYEASSYMVSKA